MKPGERSPFCIPENLRVSRARGPNGVIDKIISLVVSSDNSRQLPIIRCRQSLRAPLRKRHTAQCRNPLRRSRAVWSDIWSQAACGCSSPRAHIPSNISCASSRFILLPFPPFGSLQSDCPSSPSARILAAHASSIHWRNRLFCATIPICTTQTAFYLLHDSASRPSANKRQPQHQRPPRLGVGCPTAFRLRAGSRTPLVKREQ